MGMPSIVHLPDHFFTKRLIVRAYRPGDGPMYYAVGQRNREHLRRYEPDNSVLKPSNAEEAEELIGETIRAWAGGKYFMLGAFARDTGEFVAQIYIGVVRWETPELEVGYFADCGSEGQGFVSEALHPALALIFEHLGAHRLRLECSDTNTRSMRVAERSGFTCEAHLREDRREPDGAFTGTLIYGMLRREYLARAGKVTQ